MYINCKRTYYFHFTFYPKSTVFVENTQTHEMHVIYLQAYWLFIIIILLLGVNNYSKNNVFILISTKYF